MTPDQSTKLRALFRRNDPRRYGKIQMDNPPCARPLLDGLVMGCACDGSCLREMTDEEIAVQIGCRW